MIQLLRVSNIKRIFALLILSPLVFSVTLQEIKDAFEHHMDPPMNIYDNSFSVELQMVNELKILFSVSYYFSAVSDALITSPEWTVEDYVLGNMAYGILWVFDHETVKKSGYEFGGAVITIRYKTYSETSTTPIYHNRKYQLFDTEYDKLINFTRKYDTPGLLWREEAEGLWIKYLLPLNNEALKFTADYIEKTEDRQEIKEARLEQLKKEQEAKKEGEESLRREMGERGIYCKYTYTYKLIKEKHSWILSQSIGKDVHLNVDNSRIQWDKGTWYDGTWYNGVWAEGVWKGGTWKNGTWYSGLWEDGTWENGYWINGTWKGGTWLSGTWSQGDWQGGYDIKGKYHKAGDSPNQWHKKSWLREKLTAATCITFGGILLGVLVILGVYMSASAQGD